MKCVLIVKLGSTFPTLAETTGDFEDWIAARLGMAETETLVVNVHQQPRLPEPVSLAGVVLTGSHQMVTDREAWSEATARWLPSVINARVPLLGICYGHQLLAQAMGGTVGWSPKAARFDEHAAAKRLATIVGVSCYMALAIVSRIGDIRRFPNPRSLANFFGLTPGSRSSGEKECLGSITKQGSRIVRFLLGQLVLHVLRKDAKMRQWYRRIKKRRGAKIARVAADGLPRGSKRAAGEVPVPLLVRRERRAFSAGAIPVRQLSFQPVAIGAAMEVTRSSKPSMERAV